ncbi:MAG: DUF2378 family protein [Myxococcota bacterium]
MQRVWFREAIDGLFNRGLKDVMTPELRGQLREAGIDLGHLQLTYPVEVFMRGLELAGDVVRPGESRFEQQRELGRRFLLGYFDTPLGRALATLQRLTGPEAGLRRLPHAWRQVTNYVRTRLVSLEKGRAVLTYEPMAGLAGFVLGMGVETFTQLHRQPLRVEVREEGDVVHALVEWD